MVKKFRRTAALTAAVGAAALGLAACSQTGGGGGGEGGGGDSLLSQLQESGTVTVGINGEAPYSYIGDDGKPTGATIAIANKIYGELGIDNVEATKVAWDSLIPGLNAGRFDMVSAGMSILPDRCAQAAFAHPTIMYTTALLVPKGNPMDLHNLHDVKDSGAKLAIEAGAIEDGYADDLGIDTLKMQSPQDGMDAVISGRVDVFALTAISLNTLVEKNADKPIEATEPFIAVVNGKKQVGAGAAVFRKENDTLREAWNEKLDEIVGSSQNYEDTIGEFGFGEPWRPPKDLTTEQLCNGELPDATASSDEG